MFLSDSSMYNTSHDCTGVKLTKHIVLFLFTVDCLQSIMKYMPIVIE